MVDEFSTFLPGYVKAFCWTLVHSLWQGAVLMLLAAVVIIATRSARPALRYNLFTSLLLLFFLVNAATFIWLLPDSGEVRLFRADTVSDQILPPVDKHSVLAFSQTNFLFLTEISRFLNQQSALIAAFWMIVFLYKSYQTTAGLRYNAALRRASSAAADSWQWELRQLAARVGLFDRVTILQSALINIPLTIGIWKPVIIVPLGFLTSLPQAQVEAILLHELAHIKRRDYLVNLLQNTGENVYFFNPAFLWLSSVIRDERENCCDDLVVRTTGDETAYVHALVSFRQSQLAHGSSSVALSGYRNHLLERIKRIITSQNQPLHTMEKLLVSASLIVTLMLSANQLYQAKTQAARPEMQLVPAAPAPNPVSKPEQLAGSTIKTKPYEKRIRKVTALAAADTTSAIQAKIRELEAAVGKSDFKLAQELDYDARVLLYSAQKEIKSLQTQLKLRSNTLTSPANAAATSVRVRDEILQFDEEQISRKQAAAKVAQASYEAAAKRYYDKLRAENRESEAAGQEEIIKSLLDEKIISSRENLSYRLHKMFLIVNGVTQPEEVHQRFRDRYLKNYWKEWVYNWDGSTGYRFTGVRYNGQG